MKRTFLLIPLLLATLVGGLSLAPATADANVGRSGRGHGPEQGRQLQRMALVLGLSSEQQTQIQAILQSERQTVAPLLKSLRANREAVRKLAQAENFDEGAVRDLATAAAATRAELIVARARTQNRIHAVLTPEQRTLAAKLRRTHGERGPRRGPGPDGPEL